MNQPSHDFAHLSSRLCHLSRKDLTQGSSLGSCTPQSVRTPEKESDSVSTTTQTLPCLLPGITKRVSICCKCKTSWAERYQPTWRSRGSSSSSTQRHTYKNPLLAVGAHNSIFESAFPFVLHALHLQLEKSKSAYVSRVIEAGRERSLATLPARVEVILTLSYVHLQIESQHMVHVTFLPITLLTKYCQCSRRRRPLKDRVRRRRSHRDRS